MVLVELGSPHKVLRWDPELYDNTADFGPGDHTVPMEFHFVVPAGESWRLHIHIDCTGSP